ncbi:hypothetical protein HK101_008737, partial [Irineochytrium annulatum]
MTEKEKATKDKAVAPAAEADKAKKDAKDAPPPKKRQALEDDDEFEDFPADEGWEQAGDETLNAWVDTWEDEDESVDFAAQL